MTDDIARDDATADNDAAHATDDVASTAAPDAADTATTEATAPHVGPRSGGEPVAILEDVSYRYPDDEEHALSGVGLELRAGRFYGIAGANGAGKSTLARALSGLIPHVEAGELSGRLEVAGLAVAGTPLVRLVEDVGLVTANPFRQISGTKYTVREEIAFGLENLAVPRSEMIERIAEVAEVFGVTELLDGSPYEISMGQQQLVVIASVVAMRPRLLVLDDPTSSLDPGSTRQVFAALSRLAAGGTCVVVLGNEAELLAEFAHEVIVLAGGRVAAHAATREVLTDPRLPAWGVEPTRFTRLARAAASSDPAAYPAAPLPLTLADAVVYFGER